MDAAYFTGRKELLEFFNDLLQLHLAKIEQTCSGAVACQLTELIFPGSIPMTRVNWEAKSDYEYVQNYKLLQVAFTKNRVQRHVDVNKLIRGKYQDNLEFCQWLKAFHDQSGVYREDYDPVATRAKGKGGKRYNAMAEQGSNGKYGGSKASVPSRPRTTTARSTAAVAQRVTKTASTATTERTARPLRERAPASNSNSTAPSDAAAAAKGTTDLATQAVLADASLLKKNAELTAKTAELEQAVGDIEKERDFYFEKLRNVEVLLQVNNEKEGTDESSSDSAAGMVDKIFQILYATAEDGLIVNDEGQVVHIDDDGVVGVAEEDGAEDFGAAGDEGEGEKSFASAEEAI